MNSSARTANTVLLLWLGTGAALAAFGFKLELNDFHSPALSLISHWAGQLEKYEFVFPENKKHPERTPASEQAETTRLKRQLLAVKELLRLAKEKHHTIKESSQLFQPQLIRARKLLPEQEKRWKSNHLLNVGSTQKINEHDWIIASEHPLIDLGKDAHLHPDEIIFSGRTVTGQIDQVGKWTSSYRPISDPQFRCPATVLHVEGDQKFRQLSNAVGSFHGTEEEFCELQYIENTHPVNVGDLVILAEKELPDLKELVLGTIIKAEVHPNSPFWEIRVRPAQSEKEVREVQVIIEELNPKRFPE